jgi:signal transduction histidine kinase/ActR/RegA family two-component response regulator
MLETRCNAKIKNRKGTVNVAMNISSWIAPRPFDAELECLYQSDLRMRVFKQIKLSILIGTLVFLSFIVIDLTDPLFAHEIWIRIPAVLFGLMLWLYIHKWPERATPGIFHFSLVGAISAMIGHLAMIAGLQDASLYVGSYSSAMFVIAFVYGPLFVPILSGTLLCLSYIAILVLLGVNHSAPTGIVVQSAFQLVLIVLVSLFSRYQLEVFARRSFIDKRTADLARSVADEKRQQAEQANMEKAAFLRNASHNLRQPTQALSSYTLLLERALQDQDLSSASNAARNVTYAVDLLADGFDKILDISRIDRDDYAPVTSHVFINELLENIRRQYAQRATQKGIRFRIVLREKPPLVILSDKFVLQQIVSNLVDNAIKYTKMGWVLVMTTKSSSGIRLHVVDSGIGISTHHGQAVFQPFFRSNEQSDEPGMGIGLSYVEKAIRKLPSHRLGYYSKPDRGTHFYFDVPVVEESNIIPFHSQDRLVTELEPGTHILLVDDNTLVLDALEKQLVALGCIVEKAASIVEAHQIMKDAFRPFDLVITDYKLADGETAETLVRCVRDANENIPVIVLTGEIFSGETISLLGKEYPLLRKPASSAQISQSIAHAISFNSK